MALSTVTTTSRAWLPSPWPRFSLLARHPPHLQTIHLSPMTPPSTARLLSRTVLPEAQAFALPGSSVLTRSRSPEGPGATARTRKLSTRTFITHLDAMDPQSGPTMGSSPHEVPKLPQGSGLTLRSDAPLTRTKPSTGSAESHWYLAVGDGSADGTPPTALPS